MIKNILFDLGNVLLDIDMNSCITRFAQLGFNVKEKFMSSNSDEEFSFMEQFEKGAISDTQFRDSIRTMIRNHNLTDFQIDSAWNAMLGEFPEERLKMLENLSKQYNLYLLSNTNSIHKKNFLSRFPFEKYFVDTYYSYEIGFVKPTKEIYEYVFENSKINKHETLFFDDLIANVKVAEKLGIHSILFDPSSQKIEEIVKRELTCVTSR